MTEVIDLSLLTNEDFVGLSKYLSRLPNVEIEVTEEFVNLEVSEDTKFLFKHGDVDRNIPACIKCHGFDGLGIGTIPKITNGGFLATSFFSKLELPYSTIF